MEFATAVIAKTALTNNMIRKALTIDFILVLFFLLIIL